MCSLVFVLLDRLGLVEMDRNRNAILIRGHCDGRREPQQLVAAQIGPRRCVPLTHKGEQVSGRGRVWRRLLHQLLLNPLDVVWRNLVVVPAVGRGGGLFEAADRGLVHALAVGVDFTDRGLAVREDHGVRGRDQGYWRGLERGLQLVQGHGAEEDIALHERGGFEGRAPDGLD